MPIPSFDEIDGRRVLADITNRDLAAKAAISEATISRWRRQGVSPSARNLQKVDAALTQLIHEKRDHLRSLR